MNIDIRQLQERAAAEKWERERANEGAYERWLAASKGRAQESAWLVDTAIRRADRLATLARLKLAIAEG